MIKRIMYVFAIYIFAALFQSEVLYAMAPVKNEKIDKDNNFLLSMIFAQQSTVQMFDEIDKNLDIELDNLDSLLDLKDKHSRLSISFLLDGLMVLDTNTVLKNEIKYDLTVFSYFKEYRFGRREYTIVRYNDHYIIKREGLIKLTLSAAGDCTLGTDEDYGYNGSFMQEFERQNGDYSYFFNGVKDIFKKDDISIVNLESPITTATVKAVKEFKFKGPPEFTNILKEGNIEAVNIANNHTRDYLQQGYDDTVKYLSEAEIDFFGETITSLVELKGIKVGFLGQVGWNDSTETRKKVQTNIDKLKDEGAQLIIASFHWGIERENYPNASQKNLARYAIDCGADLIIGHHPHVLQGIDEYKGKLILYSLGNFCFGGNKNPSDKDTMIFQQTFTFADGALHKDKDIKIIPCMVSSVKSRNDYRPSIATGDDFERIKKRIITFSENYASIDIVKSSFKIKEDFVNEQ